MEKQQGPTQVPASCKPITTFVQTDTNSFREVVQRLTGPTEPNNNTSQAQKDIPCGPSNKSTVLKKPKLIERRHNMRPKLEIVKPTTHIVRPNNNNDQLVSPSQLGFHTSPLGTPSAIMSGLSITEESNNNNNNKGNNGNKISADVNSEEEEKAIKERRFYLHPSPRSRVGYSEPELLTLFPLQSPK